MNRPNFFIIGAPKCGTTSLANWLAQHPNVYFSPTKETHYFNNDRSPTNYHDEYSYLFMFATARSEQNAIIEGSEPEWLLGIGEEIVEDDGSSDETSSRVWDIPHLETLLDHGLPLWRET
jgi:hypothetical protein